MTTTEIVNVLNGTINAKEFCQRFKPALQRFVKRSDGALTSTDLNIHYEESQKRIEKNAVVGLCDAVLSHKLAPVEAQFIANVLLLSGLEFDSDETEDAVHLIATPTSEWLADFMEALQILTISN